MSMPVPSLPYLRARATRPVRACRASSGRSFTQPSWAACVTVISRTHIQRKETIGALVSHDCCTRVGQRARLRTPNGCTVLQRFDLFAPDLERAVGRTRTYCPLKERSACRAMPRRAASLRGAFAPFFGKANVSREQCLSAGATRLTDEQTMEVGTNTHWAIYPKFVPDKV